MMATAEERIQEAARAAAPEDGPPEPPMLPRLPATFWCERSVLAHIRQAAHARNRSADAVLHCVLARIAAFRPPLASIDTGIGSPASLNYMVALVDPSGGGKSSPEKIARRLLPAPSEYEDADGLPLGTGEGLAEAYMGETTRQNPDSGKVEKVRAQILHNALFYADEGQVLTRFAERRGATISESLRRAFNGEALGQTNGSRDRTRRVRDYSLGLIAGLQPAAALALLEEHSLGTPQRFAWVSVIDPSVPDKPPAFPGALRLELVSAFQQYRIDEGICAEIRRDDLARIRGELRRDPLDAHEPLMRVKLAGLLATLAGRTEVERDDWRLAGTIWETSCAVRNMIVEHGRELTKARVRQETRRHVAHTLAADRALKREEAGVERVARVVARAVRRATAPLAGRDLKHAAASRDRRYVDRAITYAVRVGWMAEESDKYVAGAIDP
jgi:hypothetical protein